MPRETIKQKIVIAECDKIINTKQASVALRLLDLVQAGYRFPFLTIEDDAFLSLSWNTDYLYMDLLITPDGSFDYVVKTKEFTYEGTERRYLGDTAPSYMEKGLHYDREQLRLHFRKSPKPKPRT